MQQNIVQSRAFALTGVTLGYNRSLLQHADVAYNRSLVRHKPMPLAPAQNDNDCTVGEVEEGTTLIGFPGDDVCVEAT